MRHRSRSLSTKKKIERKNSNDYKSCIMSFWISQEEISAQNKKIKNQISYIIEQLNQEECIILTKWVLGEFAKDFHVELASREYLAKTSKRFRKLFHQNCSPRSLCINSDSKLSALNLSFHYSESDSSDSENLKNSVNSSENTKDNEKLKKLEKTKSNLSDYISEKISPRFARRSKKIPDLDFQVIRQKEKTSPEENQRDLIRLRSHLNTIIVKLKPQNTLRTLEHTVKIFPHIKKLITEYFKYTSPRLQNIL